MNILHMRYAVEVAKYGSINKASEKLLIAQPNLSRSIKELEAELGITIFDRSTKGMMLTLEGQRFIGYAKNILKQIDNVEKIYKENAGVERKSFSVSVPRATYISDAFAQFSKMLGEKPVEVFYKETNSSRTITNVVYDNYKLGIVRFAENYEKYFTALFEEKNLKYEDIVSFGYVLVMSENSPLAQKEVIHFEDLHPFIEIGHADPYVPSLSLADVKKEELPDDGERRIFVFERASQFAVLSKNEQTFMWVSPLPEDILKRYSLVQKICPDNKKKYKDMLIYHKDYKLTELDRKFIAEVRASTSECIDIYQN